MRVAVIGAGPAGLLFSLLAKRRHPSWRIEVAEQNPEGATYGFGVVFSEGALAFLERDEPQLSKILQAEMERWPMQRIVHRDERVDIDGNRFSAIGRLALKEILQKLCCNGGVTIECGRVTAELVQDFLERKTSDGGKAVAVDIHALVAVHDALHRPALHLRLQDLRELRLVALQKRQRALGENDPQSVGRAFRVLLGDLDPPGRMPALGQQRN